MSPVRILQFGSTGQIGIEMMALAEQAGVLIRAISHQEADFLQPNVIRRIVLECEADVVVNAAGYTSVDKAEDEPQIARAVNAEAVESMAMASALRGIPMIHISTDYVFDGKKPAPYVESDRTSPSSVYGMSKLAGEYAVISENPRHVILRTSWVFSAHGNNFVKTILRLGTDRDKLNVVNDQYGSPTFAGDIAATILKISKRLATEDSKLNYGTFHYCGDGFTTWYGFAETILQLAKIWTPIKANLYPIPTAEYPAAATRPANSRLDCTKISRVYDIQTLPWRMGLERVLGQLRHQYEVET